MSSTNGGYKPARSGPQSYSTSAAMSSAKPARSLIDSTGWGNLAYVSSLGQDSQNHASSTRERSLLANGHDHHWSNSRGGTTTRDESTELPNSYLSSYDMYASDWNHQSQQYPLIQEESTTAQMIQSPESASRLASRVSKQPAPQHDRSPRPERGQDGRTSLSRLNHWEKKSSHMPHMSSQPPTTWAQIGSNSVRGLEPYQTQLPSHSELKPKGWHQLPNADLRAPRNSLPPTSESMEKTFDVAFQKRDQVFATSVASSSPNVQQKTSTTHDRHEHQSHLENPQPPTMHIRANGDNLKQRTGSENQHPTTINSNAIFDQAKDQSGPVAAAAAAATAEEAMNSAKIAVVTMVEAEAEAEANGAVGDSATKDQMELEMKQMIEKMRQYKAKDPNLFSQIWDQVKKVSAVI